MANRFQELFQGKKPIIGMIHLAGKSPEERVSRAMEELRVYQEEGLDGAIIEDYHGDANDLVNALEAASRMNLIMPYGVNFLRNSNAAFELAQRYGAKFVQLDSVSGQNNCLEQRTKFPEIVVLGGVRFKYQPPTRKPLMEDISEGKQRCDAIVTTGEGTGIETPLGKLRQFKRIMQDFPLIVGAGVDLANVRQQLEIADGAIVGSYFKQDKNTNLMVYRPNVRSLMARLGRSPF